MFAPLVHHTATTWLLVLSSVTALRHRLRSGCCDAPTLRQETFRLWRDHSVSCNTGFVLAVGLGRQRGAAMQTPFWLSGWNHSVCCDTGSVLTVSLGPQRSAVMQAAIWLSGWDRSVML